MSGPGLFSCQLGPWNALRGVWGVLMVDGMVQPSTMRQGLGDREPRRLVPICGLPPCWVLSSRTKRLATSVSTPPSTSSDYFDRLDCVGLSIQDHLFREGHQELDQQESTKTDEDPTAAQSLVQGGSDTRTEQNPGKDHQPQVDGHVMHHE